MKHRPFTAKRHKMPLHFAISNKMTSEVRCLIEGGYDVDARDQNKRTALMLCCLENDEHWSAGVTRMLLQTGADASLRDLNGRNALMFAVIFLRKSIIDILLMSIDFDVNEKDVNGRSALHYAILGGDESVIKRISNICGKQIAGPQTISRKEHPIDLDSSFGSDVKRKNSIFYNPTVPVRPCKEIARDERLTARIHKSNSDMNVHQFRRGTMQKYYRGAAWKHRHSACSSRFATVSSSNQSISIDLPNSARRYRMGVQYSFDNTRQYNSWKAYSSFFWDILSEQCAPSYRPSAKPITQSLQQALGLPVKEEILDEDAASEAETVRGVKNQLSRRGSTPNSPSPTSLVQGFAERDRRRSEASLGITAQQLKSLNDTKIRNLPKSVEEKLNLLNNSNGQLQRSMSVSRLKVDDIKLPTNDDQVQTIVSPSMPTEDLAPKKSKSPRTPIVRNRPGSALRQRLDQEYRVQNKAKSIPSIEIDSPSLTTDKTKNNEPEIRDRTLSQSMKTIKKENIPASPDPTPPQQDDKHSDRSKPNVPQRKPVRRPESVVFRDRILSDIMEENENTVNAGSLNKNPAFDAPKTNDKLNRCRPTSAYVRGRLANGRLLR
uniref:uncharacterized protein LOC120336207 isoform X1 n=1 Tax=Styela clava TaxID=7725 RepID=UPI0019398F7B|nr:uncharacterized protein LOC120336207 isoform X1 [Styela clava]